MCSPRAFFCFCHAAHQVSPLFDAPAPNPAPNTPRTPTNRNTMLATSTTIKWPFPLNSLKHGTKSSVTSGTTSLGIPKYQVQQTRLLHLAKGRKVSRKVICDAVGIYYATTTGNTEAAAEWVKDLMVRETYKPYFTFPRPKVANHISPHSLETQPTFRKSTRPIFQT